MIDLKPLTDLSFWFDLYPVALSPAFERFFFLLFGGLIIFGAVARIVARQKKGDRFLLRIYQRIGLMLLVMGLAGMLIFFFTFEEIYLLGARFWFLVWGIGFLVWIALIVRYAYVIVPKKREEMQHRTFANKYLPRKKRRK